MYNAMLYAPWGNVDVAVCRDLPPYSLGTRQAVGRGAGARPLDQCGEMCACVSVCLCVCVSRGGVLCLAEVLLWKPAEFSSFAQMLNSLQGLAIKLPFSAKGTAWRDKWLVG